MFVKYGDEEAELYNLMMAQEEAERKNRPKEDKKPKKGGRFNDEISREEASGMGLNFRDAPPRFNNNKKHHQPQAAPHGENKNLREVINEEKDREAGHYEEEKK